MNKKLKTKLSNKTGLITVNVTVQASSLISQLLHLFYYNGTSGEVAIGIRTRSIKEDGDEIFSNLVMSDCGITIEVLVGVHIQSVMKNEQYTSETRLQQIGEVK